jgi:hypothetical protein
MNSFTPNARAVALRAKAFADEMHYSDVGREHLLFAFADGAGGETIKRGFELCGLTAKAVREAIVCVDGVKRPDGLYQARSGYDDPTLRLPHTAGFEVLSMNQIFLWLTSNADMVFKMALNDVSDDANADDILRIFLREVGRSADGDSHDRRVMQVIHHIVPSPTLDDITVAMSVVYDAAIEQQEQQLTDLKRARRTLMYKGEMQEA